MGSCESLTVLSFRKNQVEAVPVEIGKLTKNLKVLDVSGNR